MKRIKQGAALAVVSAMALLTAVSPANAAQTADGYDLSGFAAAFPQVFSKDDTIVSTDSSYQSHNVAVQITRHEREGRVGDLNGDGAYSVSDTLLCARLAAEDKALSLTEEEAARADVNVDGFVDTGDIAEIFQFAASPPDSDFYALRKLVYFVADVHIRGIENLRGAFAQGKFPETGSGGNKLIFEMARENDAIFAINCDYCEIRDNGVTYRNGVMYREKGRGEIGVLYKNGVMDVLTDSQYRALSQQQKAEIWQTTAFGPGLVKDSEAVTKFTGSVEKELHPRSAIGYYEPGHYCFVLIEGRQPGYSDGMTCAELAQLMRALGCSEAFNMDGGSSSEIAFGGRRYNRPAWNGRPSSDILYLCE